MPHLQSAPEAHSDTKTRWKADGAPFKRGTAKQGAPSYVSGALLCITFSHPSAGMGNYLRYFLIGAVHGLLKVLLESRQSKDFAFLMNFSLELFS